jgi:hypothetical protein
MPLITSENPDTWQELELLVELILNECRMRARRNAELHLPSGPVVVDVLADENVHGIAAISAYTSIVTQLWPFAAGCVLVAMAGITAFFNFSYAEATLPSVEALSSFLWHGSTKWPLGRFQKPDESPEAFMKRSGRKVVWSRSLAIIFGSGSIIAFALGVLFLMRAVVTFW